VEIEGERREGWRAQGMEIGGGRGELREVSKGEGTKRGLRIG
jgi:hypothetical protein